MLHWRESPVPILVVGDVMLDRYLSGSCERIFAAAPVQVVDAHESRSLLGGGAGNVVRNTLALAGRARLLTGDDEGRWPLDDEGNSFTRSKDVLNSSRENTRKGRMASVAWHLFGQSPPRRHVYSKKVKDLPGT